MHITHIALWTSRPETVRDFYIRYFGGRSGPKYVNPTKGFASYFVCFDSEVTLEICSREDIRDRSVQPGLGYCHVAFDCGDREGVRRLTERLRNDGHRIVSEPRMTGDGFYESVTEDPEGNQVELTAR